MTAAQARKAAHTIVSKIVADVREKPTKKAPAKKPAPVVDGKTLAAGDKPDAPVAAPAPAQPTAAAATQTQKAEKKEQAPRPKLEEKLRQKSAILAVLKKEGLLIQDKGLYRVVTPESKIHPVSKRRAQSVIRQELVKPVAAGMSRGYARAWVYDPDAEQATKKPATPPAGSAAPTPTTTPESAPEAKNDAV